MQIPLKIGGKWRPAPGAAGLLRAPKNKKPGTQLLLPFVMIVLALLCGMIMALGAVQYAILIVALICTPVVMLMPSTALIALLLLMSTVVAGCLQFFARVDQAHWLPALIMVAMLARMPLDAFRASLVASKKGGTFSLVGALLWTFAFLVAISALVNLSPPLQTLVGFKQYIFPLALVAAMVQASADREFWFKIVRYVPWLVILQLPLCFYQYAFVEAGSAAKFGATGIAWDVVVGSFGGNPEGGGASGALAIFLCYGFVTILALRRNHQISAKLAVISGGAALLSIALAEVKVVVLLLPLAMLIFNRASVFRSPLSALVWLFGTLSFVVALLFTYNSLHYSRVTGAKFNLEDAFQFATKGEKDVDSYNKQTGELSRTGAIKVWVNYSYKTGSLQEVLFGHGPAASKSYSSLFGQGAVARQLPYQLQTSTASALLWDVGLLGFVAFMSLFAAAFFKAIKLANSLKQEPQLLVLAESSAVAVALTGGGLFYNNSSIQVASVQLLAAFAIGVVLLLPKLGLLLPRSEPQAAPASQSLRRARV